MPAGSYERKMFDGGATQASLQTGIDDTQLTLTVAAGEGASFPDGSAGKFVIALGLGTATEEKILVTSRSADLFTLSTRGYDDTTGNSHLAGVTVDHVLDASTIDQANRFVNLQSNKGDLVAHDGTNAQAVPVGSNDEFLVADSTQTTGVAYKSASDLNLATTAYVTTAVGDEETARIAADNTLQTNIDNLAATDIDITLTGDVTGTGTITNLGDVSFATVVADDSHSHVVSNIDSFTDNVQDIVGGMVSGNSETNITVTYQAADGTLDFDVPQQSNLIERFERTTNVDTEGTTIHTFTFNSVSNAVYKLSFFSRVQTSGYVEVHVKNASNTILQTFSMTVPSNSNRTPVHGMYVFVGTGSSMTLKLVYESVFSSSYLIGSSTSPIQALLERV